MVKLTKLNYGRTFIGIIQRGSPTTITNSSQISVSYTHLRAHETGAYLVCRLLLEKKLSLPAYDQCLKASHIFNLLDARGVIGVAERTGFITRIRELAKGCGALWLSSQS